MTIIIRPLNGHPMAAGIGVIRVPGAPASGPILRGSPCFVLCDEGTRARALHPFGQIPTYEEGDLAMPETGGSCSTSFERRTGLLLTMPMPGRARSRGCLPRSTQWNRRS